MWRIQRGAAISILFLFFVMMIGVHDVKAGRPVGFSGHSDEYQLVSDGVDGGFKKSSSVLVMRGMEYSSSSSSFSSSDEECEQMYGFLPCGNNIFGHLFLIVVYEYLMFHGESYLASGGEQIFKILGPGVFGASVFEVIGALPDSLILLASGLLTREENAQKYAFTAVGLLSGSTILLLTAVWGTCLNLANRQFSGHASGGSTSEQKPWQNLFSLFTGHGITTDEETGYMARIMGLSVIPFIIIQITRFFQSSSGERIVVLISLVVSLIFLLVYFIYQVFQPWIQQRRLEYVKHQHLVITILRHVQECTLGKLLTEDGTPNVRIIKRLFEEKDQDGDSYISPDEIKELLHEIKFRKPHLINKDEAVLDVIQQFDIDGDRKITKDEFVAGIAKGVDETKKGLEKRSYSNESLKDLQQVFRPWIMKRRKENEMKEKLMSGILRHVQSNALESLLKEDNTPHIPNIKSLFERIDLNGDNCISQTELKELIVSIKFGDMPLDIDEAVGRVMEELDADGDRLIDEEEFVQGVAKWLNISSHQAQQSPQSGNNDIYLKTWEETDQLVEENRLEQVDRSPKAWFKAIMLLMAGIVILSVLAEPLVHSVRSFSTSANIPSFFVGFILVPLATNAREASSAISAARRRKPRTTSLTFSEIYGRVFMNNCLGFLVLLSIIYVRGLSWDFSTEVLVVMIVCSMMSFSASFSSIFPVWTSIIAYLLYPLTLLVISLCA